MSNKFKLCYIPWEEKLNCFVLPNHLYLYFETVDDEIIEAAEALNGLLTGIGYNSQKDKMVQCTENFCTLNGYTYTLESQVGDVLDEPFYKAVNRATQYLSEIKIDDFETDNKFGIKVEQSYPSRGYTAKVQTEKDKLTFADFIGGGVGEGGSLKTVNCVEEFAKLFKDDYNSNKEQMEKLFGEAESVDDMLDNIESFGEFEHDLDTPLLNFVSGALDLTIVKPLIEASIGRDLITGERLTDLERGFKAGGAVIDIVTLGAGGKALKLGQMGFKQAVKAGGRYVVINTCGDLAGYSMGYVSNEMGLPPAVTIALSLSANAGASWKLGAKSYDPFAGKTKVKDLPEYENVGPYSTVKWSEYFNSKYGAENVEFDNWVNYGEHITRQGRKKILKPNISYQTPDGYKYKTDEFGNIDQVEGKLQLGNGKRNLYAQKTVGGNYRLPDDDGGHLIASEFYGSGDIDNLVPMNSNINRAGGRWRKIEQEWEKSLKEGKDVWVKIEPIYDGGSARPISFEVEYRVEGMRTKIVEIMNQAGG